MRTNPTPDPAPALDDELSQAARDPWWTPIAARLLGTLDAEPQPDDDPSPAPGR